MPEYLSAPCRSAAPTAAQLMAYLRGQGWTLAGEATKRWALFRQTSGSQVTDEDTIEIEVPLLEEARDYVRTLQVCLEDLARVSQRELGALLRDILAEGKDLLRLQIEGPSTREGRLSLEAGRGVYQGARDLFLAVASSVLEPKVVFPTRKPAAAVELLKQAQLGLPEHGSFVLVIENEVPPMLRQRSLLEPGPITAGDLPFERQVTMRFSQSMVALEDAIRRAQVSDDLEPFRDAASHGVSANLCEAVTRILSATAADRLISSVAPSSRWPLLPGVQLDPGTIGGRALPFLREVAKSMREEALYADTVVEGPVVKLHSGDPTQGGTFAVHAQAAGHERAVWIETGQADYARVTDAHRDGVLVRLVGDLKRQNGRWRLLHPRELQVVPLDSEAP